MNIIINKKFFLISFLIFLSKSANATCPPTPQPMFAGNCTDQKTISEFTGSAEQSISTVRQNIATAGKDIVRAVNDSTDAQIKIISDSSSNIIKTLIQLNGSTVSDEITRSRLLHEAKMDYMLELQDKKIQAKESPLGVNTTPEEMALIISLLEDNKNSDIKVKELIPIIKKEMDDKETKIPVKIKAADGICDDGDPNKCAVLQVVTPGKSLEMLFNECSREKRIVSAVISEQQTLDRINQTTTQSQIESLKIENTTQAANQILLKQRKISCSPEEYNAELCAEELNKREYAEAIFSNKIINNGNISAINFYNPPMLGTLNGEYNGTEEDRRIAEQNNINFEGNESIESTPPLINTYKSSNQYLAAIDMADNLLNESGVANQPLSERRNLSNAKFQTSYLSRMAGLSLSKYSLHSSINQRLGENIKNQPNYDRENPVKENFNGAGSLDQLIFDIESDYKLISGDKSEDIYQKNEKGISIMMLEAQIKQNKLVLNQILRNERIELLLATILANEYNSPEYTDYLSTLRGK